MQRRDISAFVGALLLTAATGWGLIYFVQELWPILPGWLAMLVCVLLAVIVIGYPIYSLAQWSNRYLERHPPPHRPAERREGDEQDDWDKRD